jgi:hypothetical protein
LLKFFRINHRDEQIRKQREGNDADNNVFHKFLEFFAPVGVDLARHKKQGEHGEINQVIHGLVRVVGECAMARARLAPDIGG